VADIVAIIRQGELLLVERLDELKAQVSEVTVTLADESAAPPPLGGHILSRRGKPRQWQLLVRGATDDDLAKLRSHGSVRAVDVRTPNLEEIFVAYMQSGRRDGESTAHVEATSAKEMSV
jgi:ABC-type multidrug transport system ATPase subunit